jgi:hypothetical protein
VIAPNFDLVAGMECAMIFSYMSAANVLWKSTLYPAYRFYPSSIQGMYSIGDSLAGGSTQWLQTTIGHFPYKYNPDVRNLGEYLFRTGTYPGYIMNSFDFPAQRLLGGRIGAGFVRGPLKLTADGLITSAAMLYPLQDFSPTLIAGITFAGVVELGGGIMLDRFFSVNKHYTIYEDDLTPDVDTATGDTLYMRFSGTKVMARTVIDPKPLIPEFLKEELLGVNDLRLYCEAAILGWKNYKRYYPDRAKRTIVVVGFNVPTLKVLDVFSVEWEWYGSPYPNSINEIYMQLQPFPEVPTGSFAKKEDDEKWSVYMNRSFFGGRFALTGQVARDHLRLAHFQDDLAFTREAITEKDHWHWMMKMQCGF